MLAREHPARPAHAGLDFVRDEQDAVLARELAQPLMELRRGHDVAAFALDGLDDDAGHLIGRDEVHHDLIFDVAETFRRA